MFILHQIRNNKSFKTFDKKEASAMFVIKIIFNRN